MILTGFYKRDYNFTDKADGRQVQGTKYTLHFSFPIPPSAGDGFAPVSYEAASDLVKDISAGAVRLVRGGDYDLIPDGDKLKFMFLKQAPRKEDKTT